VAQRRYIVDVLKCHRHGLLVVGSVGEIDRGVAGDVELRCFAGNGEALAFVARHVAIGDTVVEYTQLQSCAVVEPQRQLVVGNVEMFLTVKLGVDGLGDIASRARAFYR